MALQAKANAEPSYRFYSLWDKVCRKDVLAEAYRHCRNNHGAPGADRVTFEQIEATGLETWLAHLREELRESFFALKRQAAPGVDGLTWEQYEVNLESRLHDLHGSVHQGTYRAQPSRRTYIPKADGRLRPLGVATWVPYCTYHSLPSGSPDDTTRILVD